MRPALAAVITLAACAAPAVAQDAPEAEFHCDQKNLPAVLAQFCLALDSSYGEAMSRPADPAAAGRPNVKNSPVQAPVKSEVFARGIAPPPGKFPLAPPEDRGVGLRLRSTEAPVQLSTEMVQPGGGSETILNWEMKTENAPETSGLFYGAATGGTYNPQGTTENLSGFAGLRSVVKPADNVQLGAEIAPRAGVADFAAPQGTMAIEPKLSAKSNLGQLGASDFIGNIDANAGYSVPLEGDAAAWGGFRLTVKPK